MEIVGFALLGVVIFYGLLLAVVIGGAFGNKRVKNLREVVEQQRAAGITGDVTMNDDLDYGEHRYAHT
ncbi:hypothetical protein JY651_35465 [Pyxidicoccus parkwayensis]|uniref:Uncharacterized protein n=1 Tax=Pyxidicoccus parkwayensis TaxID=2813578 RepID=A0ABX7NNS1_9BACT|nr:hypothetical protein [Pyxidicoccus parkwaysis]QSQ20507.1 hypothetical protein JY651_35465 [Pyxidicoccus parkwaysis]